MLRVQPNEGEQNHPTVTRTTAHAGGAACPISGRARRLLPSARRAARKTRQGAYRGAVDRAVGACVDPMRRGVSENGSELARRVAGILQAISDRSLAAIHAFAQSPPSSRAWLDDVDRAMAFATDLETAAVGPDAPGPFDSSVHIRPG